ncbi:MAG TPA: nucleotidyltransferase [Bryobacteraceae bacterium]|nr:nucleotidyltransferase [Bryobacteraceae bacterium]
MDARPFLETLARLLEETGLEAILIGNAAAALQGAPVTTIDIDLMFRQTPRNLQKLKAVAKALEAVILRPYYPVSGLFRLSRDRDGMQIDFMTSIDGVKSFEALRARSEAMVFGGHKLRVASLEAVIESKRAAGRPQDKAVLDTLKKALDETKTKQPKRATRRLKERE